MSDHVWYYVNNPIRPSDKLPPCRKVVLVWLKNYGLPSCGYLSCSNTLKPVFLVYAKFNSSTIPEVVAWCDCLPDIGPDLPNVESYNKDQIAYFKKGTNNDTSIS